MPDSTAVDDIVVFGNRRPYGGSGGFGGGSNGGGRPGLLDGNTEMIQTREEGEPEPPYQYDPCDSAAKRREKSIDAAAAAAIADFESRALAASEDGFEVRERGAYLFYNPSTGVTTIGPVKTGDPFENGGVGTTGDLSFGDNDPQYLVGSVHTHSIGNALPSTAPPEQGDGDRGHYFGMRTMLSAMGGDPGLVRLYIAARTPYSVGGPNQYNRIGVYNQTNLQSSIDNNAPSAEVDRNGQPCSG